jgi:hypothetical protein
LIAATPPDHGGICLAQCAVAHQLTPIGRWIEQRRTRYPRRISARRHSVLALSAYATKIGRSLVPAYLENLTELDSARLREVITTWRAFLNQTRVGDETRYRVYHLSFQDFLAEEGVGLKPYHERIVMKALEKISDFGPSST